MNQSKLHILCSLFLTVLAFATSARATDVPQWTPRDFGFKANATPEETIRCAWEIAMAGKHHAS